VLCREGKYAEAAPLLLQGYEGMAKRTKDMPPYFRIERPREGLERLVRLYEATGSKEEAAKWRQKLAEIEKPGAKDAPKK
jgi:hypothetical protein